MNGWCFLDFHSAFLHDYWYLIHDGGTNPIILSVRYSRLRIVLQLMLKLSSELLPLVVLFQEFVQRRDGVYAQNRVIVFRMQH